jgi:hypothetical protein
MNVVLVCACVLRMMGVWTAVYVVQNLYTTVLTMIESGFFFTASYGAGTLWLALLSGTVVTFAPELARWAAGPGTTALETGLKMGAAYFFIVTSHLAVGTVVEFLSKPEKPSLSVEWGFQTHYVPIAPGFVVLAVVLMFAARPLGRRSASKARARGPRIGE